MERGLILILLCLAHLAGAAQGPVKVEDRIFNFGAKAGMNSAIPIVKSLSINGVEAGNISYNYDVGLLGAVFCRINMDRFFIQPSLSWTKTSGTVFFNIPSETEAAGADDKLEFNVKSLEAPVLIGYKIVKEGPYGLSFMAGPNFKYSYDTHYTSYLSNAPHDYDVGSPFRISIVCGMGVSIWRLFFDVTYEFGLNKVDSSFSDYDTEESSEANISIDKRTNTMSFSLGFLF